MLAVNEDRRGQGFYEGQQRRHLRMGRPAQAIERDISVEDAAGAGLCRFGLPGIVGEAQVDDALNAKPGEVPNAGTASGCAPR